MTYLSAIHDAATPA